MGLSSSTARALGVCAIAVLAWSAPVAGQSGPSGAVSGRVLDPSGGALPGVTVVLSNTATNDVRTIVTNGDGVYQAMALPIGVYTVTYKLDGFKTASRTNLSVEAAVPMTLDVSLEVGG